MLDIQMFSLTEMSINVWDHVTGCFSACNTKGLAKTAMYFNTLSSTSSFECTCAKLPANIN